MTLYIFKGNGNNSITWSDNTEDPPIFSNTISLSSNSSIAAYEVEIYGDSNTSLSGTTGISHSITGPSTVSSTKPLKRVLIVGDASEIVGGQTGGSDTIIAGSKVGQSLGSPFTFGNFVYGDAITIFSNAAVNSSVASGGNDNIDGGAGLNGWEQLVGDAYLIQAKKSTTGNFFDRAKGGNDRIVGSDSTRFSNLYGDAVDMKDYGTGGDDQLWGGSGTVAAPIQRQIIVGDGYEMGGFTTGGNGKADVLGGNDILVAGNDILSNRADSQSNCWLVGDGWDMLTGARGGADTLYSGNSDTNYLFGDGYSMAANTKTGADVLVGGTGSDLMWGDNYLSVGKGPAASSDRFVFGFYNKLENGNINGTLVKIGDDEIVDFDYIRKSVGDSLVFDGAFTDDLDVTNAGVAAPTTQQTWDFLRSCLVSNSGDANFNFSGKSFNGVNWSGSLYVFGLPARVFSGYTTWTAFQASADASYVSLNTFDPTPPEVPF